MVAHANNERQFQGINRTICIGLGGTGQSVLMRIRRLIVDRYGALNNLPVVSFVHIDTDKAATRAQVLRTGNTYHGEDLSFRDAEKVSATMTATEVSDLIQGLERQSTQNDRIGPFDHIARWFPPQLMRNISAVEQGAGGIRPVGRLAFFQNYRNITSAIKEADKRTSGHEQKLVRQGLEVDPRLNIFVVGSLCGGTGSGMFLDMAYSLRQIYENQGQDVEIIGYLIISPELYGNTSNMCANTYAALMELDYYSSPGVEFAACWDQQDLKWFNQKRAPFEYVYLVSGRTENGNYTIHDQRKLCNVIARKISLDFSSELAPHVKGMRDNFKKHLQDLDEHPRPNNQRYLTFGLAAIYFPRDRISEIAMTRVKSKLAAFWLQGEGQRPDPQRFLEQFLRESRWHTDLDRRDGLVTRLETIILERDKAFSALMNGWRTRQETAITECKNQDDRTNLTRQLQREFRDQFRKAIFADTESSRGIWLTKLQRSCATVADRLKQEIDSFLTELLTPGYLNFSVENTRNWLDALQAELNAYQTDLEERLRTLGADKGQEDMEQKWKDVVQSVADLEKEFHLFGIGKNSRIQEEFHKALRETAEAIKHNFDLAVTLEGLEIIKVLMQHLQKRVGQVTGLNNLVRNLKSYYEQYQVKLKQLNFDDEMSGEAIFTDADIDDCYNDLLPENEFRAQLVDITHNILASRRVESLAIFLEGDRTNQEQLRGEVDRIVGGLFNSRSNSIVQSVIKRFTQNYSTSERVIRLGQILDEGDSLLPLYSKDRWFRDTSAKRSKLVGFKDVDEPEVQQFKDTLSRDYQVSANVFKSTQAEDEVVIIKEFAAFPLRLISGLEQLRYHYSREKNSANPALHNDRHEPFTDITPPDVGIMEDIQDVFYPCLAFDLIQSNGETQPLKFQYWDASRGENQSASLNPIWNKALEELANGPKMTAALKNLLDRAIAEVDRQPDRWRVHYLPQLYEFVRMVDELPKDHPNYLYRSWVVGTTGTADTPGKEGVINRFRRQMQERVEALQAKNPSLSVITGSKEEVLEAEIDDDPAEINQGSGQGPGDIVTQLERLAKLKEKGHITDEDYLATKKRIFDS